MKNKAKEYNYGDMYNGLRTLISLLHPVTINFHGNDIFNLVRNRRAEYFDSMKGIHENMEEERLITVKQNAKKFLKEWEDILNCEKSTAKYGVPFFGNLKFTLKDDKNE